MMKTNGASSRHLKTLFKIGAIGALTDAQLLELVASDGGEGRETAFAALVERHGPSVLLICQAVLGSEHEAHDAFQATFLALAQKADSLWVRSSLGPWLRTAAYRAACHDRSTRMRCRTHERVAASMRPERSDPDNGCERLNHSAVQEEIGRLPAHYRDVLVLCALEGRTYEQAASQLGCAVGTVKSRLARGREKLRHRLIRRGVEPSWGSITAIGATSARPVVPAILVRLTTQYAVDGPATTGPVAAAVADLTNGVLTSMFLAKLKVAALTTAVVGSLAAGAAALAQKGDDRPSAGRAEGLDAASAGLSYEVLMTRDDHSARKVAFGSGTDVKPERVDTTEAAIIIHPRIQRLTKHADRPDSRLPRNNISPIRHDQEVNTSRTSAGSSLEEQYARLTKQYEAMDASTQVKVSNIMGRALEQAFSGTGRRIPDPIRWEAASNRDKDALLRAAAFAMEKAKLHEATARPAVEPVHTTSGVPHSQKTATSNAARRLDQLESKVDELAETLQRIRRTRNK